MVDADTYGCLIGGIVILGLAVAWSTPAGLFLGLSLTVWGIFRFVVEKFGE